MFEVRCMKDEKYSRDKDKRGRKRLKRRMEKEQCKEPQIE
jgi:hypothetical protein